MSANPQRTEQPERTIRIVPAQPKPEVSAKVELQKIRRELLTLAERVDKVIIKGQEQA